MKSPRFQKSTLRTFKPMLNGLEARINPASVAFVVSSLADNMFDVNTLRGAINAANTNNNPADVDTITFSPDLKGKTITLTVAGGLPVTQALQIDGGTDRSAITINGGGVGRIFTNTSNLALLNLTLTGGVSAADGGAVRNTGTLSVTNSVIFGNTAASNGGAISSTAGALTVNNSWIHNNTGSFGGGISVSGGTAVVLNSTLSINTAAINGSGGAIAVSSTGALTVVQSTLSGNKTSGNSGGGGIANFSTGTVDVRNSTITDNTARNGGGIFRSTVAGTGAVTVSSSIVAQNKLTAGGMGADFMGAFLSVTSTVTSTRAGATYGASVGPTVGDPKLGTLKRSGGLNPVHRLKVGSAAINKGVALPAIAGLDTTSDQRGKAFVRNYAGKGVDMGSVEFGSGNGKERVAVGSDQGVSSTVKVFDAAGILLKEFSPYPDFVGGVRVATGDINGDGVQDIITSAGPSGGPNVKVFDGVTFAEIVSFFAFERAFDGGVSLGVADVNDDGIADIVVAAGPGGGPRTRVFDGTKLKLTDAADPSQISDAAALANFFAFEKQFVGGVTIASADFNGDGIADLAFAAGEGSSRIRIVDGTLLNMIDANETISESAALIAAPVRPDGSSMSSFSAFGQANLNGVVLTTGDLDGDGLADLIFGDATKGSRVEVVNSSTGLTDREFPAFSTTAAGGLRLSSVDTDGDGSQDGIVVGRGPGDSSEVRVLSGTNPLMMPPIFAQEIFPGITSGVYVG